MELFLADNIEEMAMPKVTIVIPNFNGHKYLKTCMDALYRQTMQDMEILFVDNGSTDGSSEFIKHQYPEVKIIQLKENTGFCGAVNVGISNAKAPYVLLLNNDTEVTETFVEELYRAIQKDERIFSCSSKMIQYHQRERMDDAGDLFSALGWAFARGKGKHIDQYDKEKNVFFSCAGAAIYRKSILDKIGYFDENHFAYLEDADIGYRARIYGYINKYVPKAVVYHVGSGSSGSVYNHFKIQHSSRNSIYLIYKNMPFLQIMLNVPFFILGFGIKIAFFTTKGFGLEYIKGLIRGFSLCKKGKREGKKVPFLKKHFKNYCKIQIELWMNMVKRFI